MEAQRARQNEHHSATESDREFWRAMAEKWERMAAYAEAHRHQSAETKQAVLSE
jgi:hypothetical protein